MSLEQKTCFVIAPIGEEDSDTRKRSDKLLKYVIAPVVSEKGYDAIRADQIASQDSLPARSFSMSPRIRWWWPTLRREIRMSSMSWQFAMRSRGR